MLGRVFVLLVCPQLWLQQSYQSQLLSQIGYGGVLKGLILLTHHADSLQRVGQDPPPSLR